MSCPVCGFDGKKQWHARSVEQHRRFRGLVPKVFPHWRGDFVPEDAEHLRQWLLVQAEWCHTKTVRFKSDDPNVINAAALVLQSFMSELTDRQQETKVHPFIDIDLDKKTLTCSVYKSTKFPKSMHDPKGMSHENAVRIYSRCDEIICAELGVEDTEQFFDEDQGAAKLL